MKRKRSRSYSSFRNSGWGPYVSVAEKKEKAALALKRLSKKGEAPSPLVLAGRTIAHTFWGKAWCSHIEANRDYDNRLPRGKTYVRNGSVLDLKIEEGKVLAKVQGSSLYKVSIEIAPIKPQQWQLLQKKCIGKISSFIELISGKLSDSLMSILTEKNGGLFPDPEEMTYSCSCPDWAKMCKHVAATFYGVGARLDSDPALLFLLRKVDYKDLVSSSLSLNVKQTSSSKTLQSNKLTSVFGIDLDEDFLSDSEIESDSKIHVLSGINTQDEIHEPKQIVKKFIKKKTTRVVKKSVKKVTKKIDAPVKKRSRILEKMLRSDFRKKSTKKK
jgi:uncharacterized Zn finger protein